MDTINPLDIEQLELLQAVIQHAIPSIAELDPDLENLELETAYSTLEIIEREIHSYYEETEDE